MALIQTPATSRWPALCNGAVTQAGNWDLTDFFFCGKICVEQAQIVSKGGIMDKTALNIYIPKDLKEKAKEKAKKEDTSVSRKVRETLREWVEDDPPEDD